MREIGVILIIALLIGVGGCSKSTGTESVQQDKFAESMTSDRDPYTLETLLNGTVDDVLYGECSESSIPILTYPTDYIASPNPVYGPFSQGEQYVMSLKCVEQDTYVFSAQDEVG